MSSHRTSQIIERRKPQAAANRLLAVVVLAGAFGFALLLSEIVDLIKFAQAGKRHTYDHAVSDCLRANRMARELNQPVWNCGDAYDSE